MSELEELCERLGILTSAYDEGRLPGFDYEGFRSRFPDDGDKRWGQKCGALDVLLDLANGFAEFFSEENKDKRPTFFEAYGFIQGLVVQQDAVFSLGRCMGFHKNGKEYDLLKFVREVRNRSVGHPSYTEHSTHPSSGMWGPAEITREGFILTLYYDSDSENRWINFHVIYSINQKYLSEYVSEILVWIENQSKEYQSINR